MSRPGNEATLPLPPEPLGFDFWSAFPDSPSSDFVSLLRLTPYRLRITDVDTLSGRKPALAWP